MASAPPPDMARFRRPAGITGVELVSVAYRERSFPEHSHAEYVVGAVVAGAETLTVAGGTHRIGTGSSLLLNPEQPHRNATVGDEVLRYHVLYLSEEAVHRFHDPSAGAPPPRFDTPASADPAIFDAIVAAHALLGDASADPLAQESALSLLLRTLARSGGDARRSATDPAVQKEAVIVAKEYIDAHYAAAFGLADLAGMAGLSIFHFNRRFRKVVGLSPLAYRNQRRLDEARRRLLEGEAIAHVAVEVGYADQSHLTRHFQRLVGASPGRYAEQ